MMRFSRVALLCGAGVAVLVGSPAARAQMTCPCIVMDPAAEANTASSVAQEVKEVASWVQQAEQMEQQIQQATNLFNHLNELTNPNQFAQLLNNPALRQFLPTDIGQVGNLVQPGNGQFDALNGQAQQFRTTSRNYTQTAPSSTYDQKRQLSFENSGNTIATAVTEAQAIYTSTTQRLQGLEQLRLQLDSATDAKQTADLHARIGAEQANMQNDITRLQGLALQLQMQLKSTEQQEKEQAYQFHQDRRSYLGVSSSGTGQ
jgi:type IV secretion system protein VirB5